ncbi:unnamed protein product [Bursaphelenchus xylophilus]|nr:unnamed protein product [Bursaphelenchus xylophilus]CAG9101645.1 unnamed protein product [Bursaphelenchus xylophilus]
MLITSVLRCGNRAIKLHAYTVPALWTQSRQSTSSVINHLDHVRIKDISSARHLCDNLSHDEKKMLRLALQEAQNASTTVDPITSAQMKQIFTFNLLPFIGFGILDNMLMILAGEYIEHSLGAVFTISTMAAAALGNMVSDVFGMGLAHYVELFVMRMGFKLPTLTTAQLESSKARFTVNLARACGLCIGCTIGMFPLLFF